MSSDYEWPEMPSNAELLADENPTTIRRSRSCGDFLADLRGMGEQRRERAA